ncbi:DUF2829 domain-containing protein [Magnetospirillum fulvum]|uniref:Thoeris anti-defense 2-like domain-containing protein n=1 Tax=Magnetospirillum fulvum MGU-K5 TaxID=1316936 RepID=S9SFH8_MAGFU|nr:DUF2829 domain-containing protein [Magnetospirillum fulvum]EPY03494.1 hypothetical protein K678_00245 [Magnetospirillum fulvum MGU-K5]
MLTYQCHKRVKAAQIATISEVIHGETEDYRLVTTTEGEEINVKANILARWQGPVEGHYLVEYEDGYSALSPAHAFEAGYHLPGQEPARWNTTGTFDFGVAIEALKAGQRVVREGWKGKGMWLSLSCDGSRQVPAENFWSPHNAEFARKNGGMATVLPAITMKTAGGEILMGWLASQTDMLATDWQVVEATTSPTDYVI